VSRDVHRLQQAMARMLFDPDYVAAVRGGPVEGLTEAERALLVRPDPRAWGTDRFRRARAVHALVDEYPVTTALIGVSAVDAFFSAPAFATTLARRGSLALDFGDWVRPRAGAIARLEQALARARRAEPRAGAGLATRPGVEALTMPGGIFAFYLEQRRSLGPDPAATLARQARPRTRAPEPAGDPDSLLLERSDDGQVQIGGASPALVALLAFATTGRPRREVLAEARRLGCDEGDDDALVTDLLAEGLLASLPA